MSRYDGLHLSGIERGGFWRGEYAMYGMGRRCIRRRYLQGQSESRKTRQYDWDEEDFKFGYEEYREDRGTYR